MLDTKTLIRRYCSLNKALGRTIPRAQQDAEEYNIGFNMSNKADGSFTVVTDRGQFRFLYVKEGKNRNLKLQYEDTPVPEDIKDIVKRFNTVGLE